MVDIFRIWQLLKKLQKSENLCLVILKNILPEMKVPVMRNQFYLKLRFLKYYAIFKSKTATSKLKFQKVPHPPLCLYVCV
jgi:hypothetical protein